MRFLNLLLIGMSFIISGDEKDYRQIRQKRHGIQQCEESLLPPVIAYKQKHKAIISDPEFSPRISRAALRATPD